MSSRPKKGERIRIWSGIPFNGKRFYMMYRDAEFLKNSSNIEQILYKGYKLRHKLKSLAPGQSIEIEEMTIVPYFRKLTVKKSGKNDNLGGYDFTFKRLSGLVAAYAYENRQNYEQLKSSEANSLGLVWDYKDSDKAKIYLSATSGAELFTDQFSYYPLLCALRKYELKKMPIELLVQIAKIRTNNGQTMAQSVSSAFLDSQKCNMFAEGLWGYINSTTTVRELVNSDDNLKSLFNVE